LSATNTLGSGPRSSIKGSDSDANELASFYADGIAFVSCAEAKAE
jgi:hypothetical protein